MQPKVKIAEVCPRDGLQNVDVFVPTPNKFALIASLIKAGLREIQIGSFVSPKALPQFTDIEKLAALLCHEFPPELFCALVANERGAIAALTSGIVKLVFVFSVSEAHNLNNVRQSRAESLAALAKISSRIKKEGKAIAPQATKVPTTKMPQTGIQVIDEKVIGPKGTDTPEVEGQRHEQREEQRDEQGDERITKPPMEVILRADIATVFGCPWAGEINIAEILRCLEAVATLGIMEATLCDTIGMANPRLLESVLNVCRHEFPEMHLRLHLHNTRGLALANILKAYEMGVTDFDAALGGLGGCPFAPGASGNIATEDVVFMFGEMGVATGIELSRLFAATRLLKKMLPQVPIASAVFGADGSTCGK